MIKGKSGVKLLLDGLLVLTLERIPKMMFLFPCHTIQQYACTFPVNYCLLHHTYGATPLAFKQYMYNATATKTYGFLKCKRAGMDDLHADDLMVCICVFLYNTCFEISVCGLLFLWTLSD